MLRRSCTGLTLFLVLHTRMPLPRVGYIVWSYPDRYCLHRLLLPLLPQVRSRLTYRFYSSGQKMLLRWRYYPRLVLPTNPAYGTCTMVAPSLHNTFRLYPTIHRSMVTI